MFEEHASEVRYANLKQIAGAGVRVALGSDSFCGFGEFGENTDRRSRAIGSGGNCAVGNPEDGYQKRRRASWDRCFGTIAPGKSQNLILVDGDPSKNISALRNVLVVIKNGTIVLDRM